jgi:hypothetical protein
VIADFPRQLNAQGMVAVASFITGDTQPTTRHTKDQIDITITINISRRQQT